MFCPRCGRESADDAAFCTGCGAGFYAPVPPVNKPRLSLAAGIIDLAAGGLSVVSMLFATVFLLSAVEADTGMPFFVAFIPLAMLVPSVLAIVGGVFALKRRNWVMALIGSIGLAVTSTMVGVAAVVLTVMARDEFEK